MIEIRDIDDLQKLEAMQTERPEKILFMLGIAKQVTLVKEAESDMELACKCCFFKTKRALCKATPCEGVLFRQVELGE